MSKVDPTVLKIAGIAVGALCLVGAALFPAQATALASAGTGLIAYMLRAPGDVAKPKESE